jgi:hypothetical protein
MRTDEVEDLSRAHDAGRARATLRNFPFETRLASKISITP